MEREASFYEKRKDGKVRCRLCPHNCVIGEGRTGICGVRRNIGGTLNTLIYGEVSSISMDPIEKKPLYHFHPGSSILSIGTVGCSFCCQFCQNYSISQNPEFKTDTYSAQELVQHARTRSSIGIAYTYSEPFIWYEFVYDTCVEFRSAGMKNVFVTNGYINPEPLRELLPLSDGFNIDLKSFSDEFYRKYTGGRLAPVQKTIEEVARQKGVVLEVTTLVIPGYNDSDDEMERLTDWLASLRRDIPYHLSAYYPMYRFTAPPTPSSTLERLREIAKKKLDYVYVGNVRNDSNSYCPHCGSVLVERLGYSIKVRSLREGKCTNCGTSVPIMG